MKKRRELDALVGNAKIRRKSKSGHELLRSNGESESSDMDECSVSSSRSYKSIRSSGSLCTTCITVLGFLLLVACILVCGGLTWMHIELKKNLESLRSDLRAVDVRGESNMEDIVHVRDQLQELTKDVKGLKSIEQSVEQVLKNSTFSQKLSQLSNTVDKLGEGLKAAPELKQIPDKLQTVSTSVATLGSDVTGMKESIISHDKSLKDVTSQLNQLAESVGKLGKVANQSTDHIDSDNNHHPDGQISLMSPEIADLLSKLQLLPNQFSQLNETVFNKLADIQLILQNYQVKLSSLENLTVILNNLSSVLADHNNLTGSQFDMVRTSGFPADPNSQMLSVLKQMELLLRQNNFSSVPADHSNLTGSQLDRDIMSSYPTDLQSQMLSVVKQMDIILKQIIAVEENRTAEAGVVKLDQHTVNEIMENLDNITEVVATLKEEHKRLIAVGNKVVSPEPGAMPAGVVTLVMFQTFGEEIASEFDGVNKTLVKLHQDVDDVLVSFTRHTNQIVNLTAQVEGLWRYIHRIETSLHQIAAGPQESTEPSVTQPNEVKRTKPTTTVTTSSKYEKQESTELKIPTTSHSAELPAVKENPDHKNRTLPVLHSKLIPSENDLEQDFVRWDEDGSGNVPYETLQNHLGPHTPTEDELKLFDFNHDGRYDLDEFKVAFGYAQPPDDPDIV